MAAWFNLAFSSSQTRNNITVHIIDDLNPESDEYFNVTVFSSNPDCEAGRPARVIIIADDGILLILLTC